MLKRPASYSDSFLVLGASASALEPLVLVPDSLVPDSPRVDRIGTLRNIQEPQQQLQRQSPWPKRIGIFLLKSSIHVFLISVFETLFFFSYVSVTENEGIVKTIDTYYEPIRDACPTWGNLTKWVLYDVLKDADVPAIDAEASVALQGRNTYNQSLLHKSLAVSGVCLGVFVGGVGIAWWRAVKIPWAGVLSENLMMVVLLGLYEYFFFRVIIYNYATLSTQELNAHIVDGLWECVGGL